jgi:hypothetical protein
MIRFRAVKMSCPTAVERDLSAYGIVAEERDGGGWRQIAAVPDISCDETFVVELARKCTCGQLSPIQLLDVVVDSIP